MTSIDLLELLQLDVPEVIDWSNLPWENPDNDRTFTEAQQKEIILFQKQERVSSAKRDRYDAYQKKLCELQHSFDRAESIFNQNIISPFKLSIWTNDIAETRKRAIPAYAFDRFLDLPKEIQFMIWSLTIETSERKTHMLLSMTREYQGIVDDHQRDTYNPFGSTSIFKPYYNGYGPSSDEGPVFLTEVCPDAYRAYRNMYSYLKCREAGGNLRPKIYNTWSDEFYMGESLWTDWKILVDMIIMQNTTRPINKSVASEVAALQNICHLTVDLNIFGGAPASIWRQFSRLKVLTIAFYPYRTIEDQDHSQDPFRDPYEDNFTVSCNLVFTKPRRNKKFLKRAETILELAAKSLKAAAAEFPTWKIPILKVVVKKSGVKKLDQEAEHDDEQLMEDLPEDDDSVYLDQLPLRLSHPPISVEQIKIWKQRFHPSRRRTFMEALLENASSGSGPFRRSPYYADSEGGSDDERPYSGVVHGELS